MMKNIHYMIKTGDDSIFATQDAEMLKGGVLHRKQNSQHLVDSTSKEDRRMFSYILCEMMKNVVDK